MIYGLPHFLQLTDSWSLDRANHVHTPNSNCLMWIPKLMPLKYIQAWESICPLGFFNWLGASTQFNRWHFLLNFWLLVYVFLESGTNIPWDSTQWSRSPLTCPLDLSRSPLRHFVLMHPCTYPISHVILKLHLLRFPQMHPSFQPRARVPSSILCTNLYASRLAPTNCFYYVYTDFLNHNLIIKVKFLHRVFLVSDVPTFSSHTRAWPPELFTPSCFCAMQVSLHVCRTYFPHLLCLKISWYELHVCVLSKFICQKLIP